MRDYARIAAPLTDVLKGSTATDKKGELMEHGKLGNEQVASIQKD